ncbi:crossover junction endodeoxyribonuclease RuvC [Paraburkholderia sp. BCC1886]|uniref:crossover junction endodeoxyribonuclease RuvC n=1 Tax=Paraburkholderia sp. BCC1886 TaxID=2562670 RepID=UPI001183E430|nr:crossover junction endodeoxyribonuclease RuvC [Paraburkholderia sp. BCC1886]
MIAMPHGASSIAAIIGIDPGSNTLGVGTIWVDLSNFQIVSSDARTLQGDRYYRESWTSTMFGDRLNRIAALEEELLGTFLFTQPFLIGSEAPFINKRFPQAGLALTEVMCGIRNAVMRYDAWKKLYVFDPPTVKNAVGAAGNADKDGVKAKLMLLPDLRYSGDIPLDNLDEHSIDALAVALTVWKQFKEQAC